MKSFFIFSLSFLISSLTFGRVGERDVFQRLKKKEHIVTRVYPVTLKAGRQNISLHQKLIVKGCQAHLKTYHEEFGFLYGDQYDLTKYFVFRMARKFKGSYGVFFGLKSHLTERSRLYFNSKRDRLKTLRPLRKISLLCKKRKVRRYFRKLHLKKRQQQQPSRIGGIPTSDLDNAGKVYTRESRHLMANLEGRMSLRERYRSIKEAKKSILIQMFIFRADEAGKFFSNLLSKKREEGLDVRLNLDGVTVNALDGINQKTKADSKNQKIMLHNMMASGIRIHGFSCRRPMVNELRGIDLAKLIRRNHEKMWLVDAELANHPVKGISSVGILGGINIAQEYFALSWEGKAPYRDQDVAVRGPILKDLKMAFERSFLGRALRYKTYREDKYCFNSFDPIKEKENFLRFKKEKTLPYFEQTGEKDKAWSEGQRENLRSVLWGDGHGNSGEATKELWGPRKIKYFPVEGVRFLHSRPEEKEQFIYEAYINLVEKAEKEILISNGYFLLPPRLKRALSNAIARGVEVTILTNGISVNNLSFISRMNRYRYIEYIDPLEREKSNFYGLKEIPPLFENVSFYEWAGKRKDSDVQVASTLHNKYMIVDEKLALVGSYNLDYSSLKNSEIALVYEGSSLAKNLKDFFLRDLLYAEKVTLDEMIQFRYPEGKDKMIVSILKLIEHHL
jgi:phosphatidylserine/phosphatidylglycerophosphate/cardiolipin synthase-like enzyme